MSKSFNVEAAYAVLTVQGNFHAFSTEQLTALQAHAVSIGAEGWRGLIARHLHTEKVNAELLKPAKERGVYIQNLSTREEGCIQTGGKGLKSKMRGKGLTKSVLREFLTEMNDFVENVYVDPGTSSTYVEPEPATEPAPEATPVIESAGDAGAAKSNGRAKTAA